MNKLICATRGSRKPLVEQLSDFTPSCATEKNNERILAIQIRCVPNHPNPLGPSTRPLRPLQLRVAGEESTLAHAANGPTTRTDDARALAAALLGDRGSALAVFLSRTVDLAAASRASERWAGPLSALQSSVALANWRAHAHRGQYCDLGGKTMRDAVRDKERCKRRRTPTQDPSTVLTGKSPACSS